MLVGWQAAVVVLFSVAIAVALLFPGGAVAAAVLGIAVPVFLLARRAPHVVICLTFAFLCFEQFIFTLVSTQAILFIKVLPDVILLAVTLAIGDKVFRRRGSSHMGIAILALAVFMVLVSGFVNGIRSDDFLYYGRKILRYVPFVLIAPVAFEGEASKAFFRQVLTLLATIQILAGVIQLWGGEAAYHYFRPTVESVSFGDYEVPVARTISVIEGTRLVGTMGTYMDFGLFMLLAGCFLLPWSIDSKIPLASRFKSLVLLAAVSCCLVLSFSRMTILGGVIALGAFLARQRRWTALALYAAACALLLMLPFLYAEVVTSSAERATRIVDRIWATYDFDYLDPRRYTRAFLVFAVAPAVLADSPLFGLGPGFSRMSVLALPSWNLPLYMADNGYVSLLVQHGLFGVGLFLSFMTWLLHSLGKAWAVARSTEQRQLIVSLITYLSALLVVHFFVDVLTVRYVSFAFWLCCGMAVGLIADLRNGPAPSSARPA